MKLLKMDQEFARRYVNEGFSGGEKKRAEILQMGILDPDLAIMDETDSGLDIDALRTVAEGVNALTTPKLGVVLITHYQRLLNYIKPQFVHILYQGRMIESGGPELALQLEAEGYDPVIAKHAPVLRGRHRREGLDGCKDHTADRRAGRLQVRLQRQRPRDVHLSHREGAERRGRPRDLEGEERAAVDDATSG